MKFFQEIRLTRIALLTAIGLLYGASSLSAQFRSPLQTTAKPWTKTPIITTSEYRFVVLADRTGGPDRKTFQQAVAEANRLAPDFVICVGDLIDGYVSDLKYSAPQWEEINKIISELDAPFFYVGGNHDLSSQLMTDDWKHRFGTTYYHFEVGDDLFLVLDSEEHSDHPISRAQIDYFASVLKGWKGRWIYLFMHTPLWKANYRSGYEEIANLLEGHDFTLLSGHEHLYYMENIGGHEHYALATTGGDMFNRGEMVGEFDHYLFVTARSPRPVIANLRVGSMLPNDIVNPKTKPYVNTLLDDNYVHIVPVVLPSAGEDRFETTLETKNEHTQPMFFRAKMPQIPGLAFSPEIISDTIPSKNTHKIIVKIHNTSGLPIDKLPKPQIETSCGYMLSGQRVEVSMTRPLLADYIRRCKTGESVTVECKAPDYIKEDWDWHGTEDGWFEFRVSRLKDKLEIEIRTHDDLLVVDPNTSSPQDRVYILLSDDAAGGYARYYQWELRPGQPLTAMERHSPAWQKEISGHCYTDGKSIHGTVAIPIKYIHSDRIRINAAFVDCDNPRNTKPSVLWWHPRWNTASDYAESGVFLLE